MVMVDVLQATTNPFRGILPTPEALPTDPAVFRQQLAYSLQRWTDLQKLNVQLEASYAFQKHSLARWQLVTNQMANVITSSAQHLWRRMRGVNAPEVALARQIHLRHLKRALSND